MMMSWPYVAGFTDGEGCIRFQSQHGFRPHIQIAQSGQIGKEVLTEIQSFLTSAGITSYIQCRPQKNANYLDAWALMLSKKDDAIRFLTAVTPYLRVKRVVAQDLLRFFKLYPDWASFARRKDHCVNGHPLTADNIISDILPSRKFGRRRCKICHRRYMKTWEDKQKAKVA